MGTKWAISGRGVQLYVPPQSFLAGHRFTVYSAIANMIATYANGETIVNGVSHIEGLEKVVARG